MPSARSSGTNHGTTVTLPRGQPSSETLRRFLLGDLSPDDAEPVEAWIATDPTAADTVRNLAAEDTLTSAVREAAGVRPPDTIEPAPVIRSAIGAAPGSSRATHTAAPYASRAGTQSGLPVASRVDKPPTESTTSRVGTAIGGYRIERELGRGGMGVVFEAVDAQLGRRVAVKVLGPGVAAEPTARDRFLREAQAAAAVEHDNLVPVLHVGEDAGTPFLVMPLLHGRSLDRRLNDGPMAVPEALEIAGQVLAGLAAAHARGLIHRDIKPSNVWLEENPDGSFRRSRVIDFGLARATGPGNQLTATGQVVGTPAYMAPEQANGKPVDARADLFAVGCMVYRMVAGRAPFQRGTAMATLLAVANERPVPLNAAAPGISPALSRVVSRLLSKKPSGRPSTADDAAAELKSALREAVIAAPARTRRWIGFASAGVAATLALAVLAATRLAPQAGAQNDPPPPTKKDDKPGPLPPPPPPTKKDGFIPVLPPPPPKPGTPLSPLALVKQPAALPGLLGWTVETRRHREPIRAVEFSPDGALLAAGGEDGTIRVYDAKTLTLSKVIIGNEGHCCKLAWSKDGKRLFVDDIRGEGQGRRVGIWDYATGNQVGILTAADGNRLIHWDLSPDGTTLAGTVQNPITRIGALQLYDVATGKVSANLAPAKDESFTGAAWNPDGRHLAVGTSEGQVWLWDSRDRRVADVVGTKLGVQYPAVCLAWRPDGKRLAVRNVHKVPVVYFGDETVNLPTATHGFSLLAYSPDGSRLLTNPGFTAKLFDPAKPTQEGDTVVSTLIDTAAWAPDGRSFAVAYEKLELFDSYGQRAGSLDKMGRFRCSGDGHYRVAEADAADVVYVARTEKGQETLTPSEFAQRYGWTNDPGKVFGGN